MGVTCPINKWTKAQGLLESLKAEMASSATLQRKPLESMRGFFIHLMRTFPIITPYLKGIHLTLDGWRPQRDSDMWKVVEHQEGEEPSHYPYPTDAPMRLELAPRLPADLHCLLQLFAAPTPPTRMIRCTTRRVAV